MAVAKVSKSAAEGLALSGRFCRQNALYSPDGALA